MTTQEIKDLMEKMSRTGLTVLEWEGDGNRLRLERTQSVAAAGRLSQDAPADAAAGRLPRPAHPLDAETMSGQAAWTDAGRDGEDGEEGAAASPNGQIICSPVVGIYFASPSPDSDPFITVGCAVEAGSPLCIIEAMKLMNEVTSPWDGTVVEIMVENGQRVEFGQPLFKIDTNERT